MGLSTAARPDSATDLPQFVRWNGSDLGHVQHHVNARGGLVALTGCLALALTGCSSADRSTGSGATGSGATDSVEREAAALRPDVVPFPDVVVLGPNGPAQPAAQVVAMESGDLVGARWRLLDPTDDFTPYYGDSELFVSVTFDGRRWAVRDCSLDLSAPGTAGEHVDITGEWEAAPDPDPGASCVFKPNAGGWMEFLESGPRLQRAGGALVLSRTAYRAEWDPDLLLDVPVALKSLPAEVARANQAWTEAVGSSGLAYDYQPLESPEDALDTAHAVVLGDITGAQPRGGAGNGPDRVAIRAKVREVFADAGDLRVGDAFEFSVETGPGNRAQIEDGPQPGGPVLLVLGDHEGTLTPYPDGVWLQGVAGPINPHVPLTEMKPGWRYQDSVEAMAAEMRYAAHRVDARP